jgi:hypothetical protein
MSIRVVRELEEPWSGRACLVHRESDDAYFVVSSIAAGIFPAETLAFPAFADGAVESMLEVAGGRGASREEIIQELESEPER